ncbi:hypothetical protein [Bradyrhizobium vignae]|uniref:Uncharacterized protein n=1 Tax=Bradyrhizobium vignae TaxID=1549949 RepID=A0A2U3Q8X4_9BRAD|nr:hypothetical protein [Bradyrhizobium vignae]SPP97816.1 conserved protein of unknown function [Bradyrhizobium vignae]
MRFKKAGGLTASEKVLADLCEKSFLSLWSYPNLYRKSGKELTDLLVVFGNDVILSSDKSCAFPDSGDADLDWERWFRRSITKSAEQITQAEEWIKRQPFRLFLDAKATQPLPLPLPPTDRMRVYRVCIALGAAERCKAATGYATLELSPPTVDDEKRFAVGRVSNTHGWVHVFDDTTLPIILAELSTIADFLDYLRKKEALYDGGQFVRSFSELDLLGYFLWNNRGFPEVGNGPYGTDPDLWAKVEADEGFLRGREENKISAFCDGLIEYLTELYMKEELEHGNDHEVADHERMVHIMAAESRFMRRVLSKWILERAELAKKGYVSSLLASEQKDVLYVLVIGPGDDGRDHQTYRDDRKTRLAARMYAAKAVHPERRMILGIALDARDVKGSSEDFILMDTSGWTAEDLVKAEAIRQEGGFFVGHRLRIDEKEYPDAVDPNA